MGDFSRKAIEAIKSSLLGGLFARLWPLFSGAVLIDRGWVAHPIFVASFYATIFIAIFMAWLLGFLAIHRRPKGRLVLIRLPNAPSNGFGVWYQVPVGGLKPPGAMRSVVMILGRTGRQSPWSDQLTTALLLAAIILFIAAGYRDGALLARISASLFDPSIRNDVMVGSGLWCIAFAVRAWAVDCRKSLVVAAPPESHPRELESLGR